MMGGVPLVTLAHEWGCTVALTGALPGGLGGRGVGVHVALTGAVQGGLGGLGAHVVCLGGRGFCHLSQPLAQNLVHTEFMISSL